LQKATYIGYNEIGSLATDYALSVATAAAAAAQGGLNLQADIAAIASQVKFFGSLWNQWTSHPARDAKDFISKAKLDIANTTPYDRIVKVLAYSQKINPKAIDVNTREWLKWYKQNYPNDYTTIPPNVKIYYNNYLNEIRNTYGNVNRIFEDLDIAAFTSSEINYNATPVETVKNLFTSTSTGKINWVLYGAIGLGAILLIKNLK